MPKAGRAGDKSQAMIDNHGKQCCPHPNVSGPSSGGSPDVFINDLPALRVHDKGQHMVCCGPQTWVAVKGASAVTINNLPAHRVGDEDEHCGGKGMLIEGSDDVLIGDSTGGGSGGASASADAAPLS